MSDIQETNRVVRLAKAHTDLALLVCKIPVDQVCFVSYGDASGGSTRAEQAQSGYVIMFADLSLLAGLASPVTPVSWRSHSASAAEAMGLSLSRTQRVISITCTTQQSAPVRTEGVLLIWQLFGKTYPDHRCSCGGLMGRRKWQTP